MQDTTIDNTHEPDAEFKGRLFPLLLAAVLSGFIAALLVGASWSGSTDPPPPSESKLPVDVSVVQKLNDQVPPDVTFRDETGDTVRLSDYLDDKPVILNIVYFECPMLCNLVMEGLVKSLRTLQFSAGQEFTVLTVSFDPREGPQLAAAAKQTAMRRYARDGAEDGWHFLTGDEPSIRRLTDAVGFHYTFDEKTGNYAHAAVLIVLTPEGKISRYFNGVEFPPRDLRLGLVEASDNKIGTMTDQVLLLCYQYDPSKGRYSLMVMNILRFAGVSTVLAMAAGIFILVRRERREGKAPSAT